MGSAKILICVEGAKTEEKILKHLFKIYDLALDYEIVSYKTNIYVLYQQMFAEKDQDDRDLLQTLKEHERDSDKKSILDAHYSDIILIFDFDPQDGLFSEEKINEMLVFFDESTENGKLYINYPMAEAFYHMPTIPDAGFQNRTVHIQTLIEHRYKALVNTETVRNNYDMFATTKSECDYVIIEHYKKAWKLLNLKPEEKNFPSFLDVLNAQINNMKLSNEISVLCTCVSFILEYDGNLVDIQV